MSLSIKHHCKVGLMKKSIQQHLLLRMNISLIESIIGKTADGGHTKHSM